MRRHILQRFFYGLSPLAIGLLLATNFPELESKIWATNLVGPILAISFTAWFFSFLIVLFATFFSSSFKEQILAKVVLHDDQDEREELISGQAARKSILITLAASVFILICTTGQYNKAETTEKSSITIGNFHLTDSDSKITQDDDGNPIEHYQLPMSKMSLVLLIILIQLLSYHSITFMKLRKTEA